MKKHKQVDINLGSQFEHRLWDELGSQISTQLWHLLVKQLWDPPVQRLETQFTLEMEVNLDSICQTLMTD